MKSNPKARKIAGLLLAAGGSSRLGFPKQLIKIDGQVLINRMISVIREGGIIDLFVVVGALQEQIRAVVQDPHVVFVENMEWEKGLSASIRCGIKRIQKDYDAAIIFVVDQPFLATALIMEIKSLLETSEAEIIATRVANQQTHPVAYRKTVFKDLLSLEGDRGGKQIIRSAQQVAWVDWPDNELLKDIDTWQDVENLNDLQRPVPGPH